MRYLILTILSAIGLFGQGQQPTPLFNAYIPGITTTTIIDNRSVVNRGVTYVSIACSGTGSWQAEIKYGSSPTGSWTSYGSTAIVSNASNPATGVGFLKLPPNYIQIVIDSGTPSCDFSGLKNFFPYSGSIGGVVSFNSRSGVVTPQSADYTAAQVTNAFDTTANNPLGAHYQDLTDISSPSAGASGHTRFYSKGGKICSLDSSSNEYCTANLANYATYSSIQSGASAYCRSVTGNTTYTCSVTPALTAYSNGTCIVLNADTSNTTTATLNVNGLGAISILDHAGSALAANAIVGNQPVTMCYNGAAFILQGSTTSGGLNQLTGDVTAGPGTGSQAATLATVNSNVGSCGDATHVSQVVLDAKGRATSCTPVLITTSSTVGFGFSLSTPVITVGTNCSSSTTTNPCLVKFGDKVITAATGTFSATLTASTVAATIFISVDSSGGLHCDYQSGTGVTLTVSGCTATALTPAYPSAVTFPAGNYPILQCTTTTAPAISGCANYTAVMSVGPTLNQGSGISITQTSTGSTISATGGVTPVFGTAGTGHHWIFSEPANVLSFIPNSNANDTIFYEFEFGLGQETWSKLAGFQAAGDTGKHLALAIYASDGAGGCTLLQSTATGTSTANQAFELALSASITMTNGVYYLAFTTDSAGVIALYGSFSSSLSYSILNIESTKRVFKGTASTGTSTLVFPSTCGSRTAVSSELPSLVAFP